MDVPRLLAIDNVHLTASPAVSDSLCDLYANVLGFQLLEPADESAHDDGKRMVFRGHPRSGPRLVIELTADRLERPLRRQALIQVGPLQVCAEALAQRRIAFEWCSGWFHFDRRLGVVDPGGNWIELVSSHSW